MNLNWLTICAGGPDEPTASRPSSLPTSPSLLGSVVLLGIVAVRSRDLSTATLALMPVAIAINIAVGSIIVALRLPIYLDSIGTVLVGALAGPWAGALTGLLANLIWSILPIPGGAGPTIAFFAPVAGVIGLMAGFWASRGVFKLRPDDTRVGGFLALAAGIVGCRDRADRGPADGRPPVARADDPDFADPLRDPRRRHHPVGVLVAWLSAGPSSPSSPTIRAFRRYLVVAAALSAFALVFALLRLLFAPTGCFSTIDGLEADGPDDFLAAPTSPASRCPTRPGYRRWSHRPGSSSARLWAWAPRGDNARLFPVWVAGFTTGLVAAAISAPIAAGVFGGVTGPGPTPSWRCSGPWV